MKGFIKAVEDVKLWFQGGKTRRTLRSAKQSSSTQPSSPPPGSHTFTSTSGTWTVASDIWALPDVEKYEQLADLLDTRVRDDRGWLKCLQGSDTWHLMSKLNETDLAQAERLCRDLSKRLFELVSHFAGEYNDTVRTVISMTAPSEVTEKRKVNKPGGVESTESVVYIRWRASTVSWALSCRSRGGVIEIFLVPSSDLMALSQAEVQMRLKLKMELFKVMEHLVWTSNGLPVSAEELRVTMRGLFRDLVSITQDQEQPAQSKSSFGAVDDAKLARSIENLLFERENLAQKVVIQQEEIQKRIARDLHDAVISDVMALKRNLSSSQTVQNADVMASLEGIVRKLREICYDLSPRDLSDWGLATVVEDMLSQMEQRTGIDCQLYCDIDVPVVPAAVLLHIYRIVQESLNNAEKYAQPSRVTVTLEMEADKFIATVADNGKGFDMEATGDKAGRAGGYGMGSLKERADLIRCFFPTKLFINSTPGKGTKVRLEIDLARFS